jgi:hypothetical protein
MKILTQLLLSGTLLISCGIHTDAREVLSLQGEWDFKLDPENIGQKEKWYTQILPDKVRLPGSLDEQGIGMKYTVRSQGHLTRESQYIGAAWYQKEIVIPEDWEGMNITLFLERVCWETRVYIDGYYVDTRNSLTTPHIYDLTDQLLPGKHRLTIRVDNTVKINIGHTLGNMLWTTAITEETQTNWNGMIGRLELLASPKVRINSLNVFPDYKKQITTIRISLQNKSGKRIQGKVELLNPSNGVILTEKPVDLDSIENKIHIEIPFGESPAFWDEFSPSLTSFQVKLDAAGYTDMQTVQFGLRDFHASGHHFILNNRIIFLRGNVDCAIFPLTGYPPMTVAAWRHNFTIYKDYGFNHVRFHSWCPPEAAFQAADEEGMILHIELPLWDGYGMVGSIPERATFLIEEANRIIETYGNHPSFCLMSMGNELGDGKEPFLAYLVDYLQKKDPRHLYTSTTHPADPARHDDYFVAAATDRGPVRGILPFGDYGDKLESLDRPLIIHEMGYIAMYPDYLAIGKYTGNLKPFYLEDFKKTLMDHHMLDQAENFRRSSGAFMVELYKENIESQLRTPNVAGFQLLDIQDFPGQGVALVGILDPFLDSKGIITPGQFRNFCSATVPLIRMRGFTWSNNETFSAAAEIAHFGKNDLKDQQPVWIIRDQHNRVVQSGSFNRTDIPTGKSTFLGEIQFSLNCIKKAEQLTLEVSLSGTGITNSWKCWVYPAGIMEENPEDIFIAKSWDENARNRLAHGEKVLLLPDSGSLANVEKSGWLPVLWSYQLFNTQPVTMGILCNPGHPSLRDFPTAANADWQWRSLLDHSEALVLDDASSGLKPLVQFIPDFNNNKKLAAIFEARVGKGKLLVCTIHLQKIIKTNPEARQLMHSLLEYMKSDKFKPECTLDPGLADLILRSVIPVN